MKVEYKKLIACKKCGQMVYPHQIHIEHYVRGLCGTCAAPLHKKRLLYHKYVTSVPMEMMDNGYRMGRKQSFTDFVYCYERSVHL
jgi:DNA-directed RNA polymerase subunit M/transcription elongation factor TFIIS